MDYLEDMLDAMDKAEILLEDVTYDQFEADFRINFAVVRALETIGIYPMVVQAEYTFFTPNR